MKTVLCRALLALGLGFNALSCALAAPLTEVRTAWPVNAGPLNPHLYSPNQMYAQGMVYEPLVKYSAEGRIVPWLATRWTHSTDGKVWTFTLREGVQFSNGEVFDAKAAEANFRAVLDNRQRHAWLELANQIVEARALNARELQITLKSAYYPFLQELALPRPFRFIAPSQFKQGGTKDGILAPIGTGPWVLKASSLNQFDEFVRNERYWGTKPALTKVTVKVLPDPNARALALEAGELDMLYGGEGVVPLDTYARFARDRAYRTKLSAPTESTMLALNTARAPTNELAVRQALNEAVNKRVLIDKVLHGTLQVADALFAPGVPYANLGLKPYAYDPAKAAQTLEAGGWKLPAGRSIREKNGQPLRIELAFVGTNAQSKAMAEALQADFRRIGADVQLIGEEESSIYARQRDGRFGMIFARTFGAPYDPHAFMSSMRTPSHADYQAQRGLPDKAELDAKISAVLSTTDEATRARLYREVLSRLHAEAVYLPLGYVRLVAVSRPALGEIPFSPLSSEIPFEQIRPRQP